MKRPTVKFMSTLMEAIGFPILDSTKHKFLRNCRLIISFLFTFWCTTQFLVISILHTNNFYRFVMPTSYSLLLIFIFASLLANVSLLRKTKQLLKNLDKNIHTYPDDEEIFPLAERLSYEKRSLPIFFFTIMPSVFHTMLNGISPFIQFLLMGHVVVIVYPGWIPWSTDGIIPFVSTYLLHTAIGFSTALQFGFINCFPMFVMFEFRQQCKRMNVALKTMEYRCRDRCLNPTRINHFNGGTSKKQFSEEFRSNIIYCIRHYQMLIR